MRVVDRVLDHTAHTGPKPHPAHTASLADRDVLVLDIADLTNCGPAVLGYVPHLARRHPQQGPLAFLGHQLGGGAGRADHLAALARLDLDIVQRRAVRNVDQGQAVAGPDVGIRAGHHLSADLQSDRSQYVPLIAIGVVKQGQTSRPVGVVLDGGDARRHAILVPPEVDDTVTAPVPAAPVTHGHAALGIAAASAPQRFGQGLLGLSLGDVREIINRHRPSARRCRFKSSNCHVMSLLGLLY